MAATLKSQTPPARAPAPGARASLILLLTINLFNYIDRYVLAAVLPKIQDDFFGADTAAAATKMGSLATAFMVSYMVAAPIFGFLADRMSRWVLIALSVAVWSLASGASGLAGTFTLLFLTRCFVGIGEAGYGPAAPTLISDLYPVERRGSVLAWFYMALPVGSALGFVFGGVVAAYLGWRWAFYLVVPPGLLLAYLSFRMRQRAQVAASTAPKHKATAAEYVALLKIPSYLLDTAGMVMMTFAIGGFSFFMPTYLVATGAGSLEKVNSIFGAMLVVTGIAATLVGGFVGDYLRRYASGSYFLVSAAGIILAAGCMLLMIQSSFKPPLPMAWVWLFCALFFLFLNTGPSNTILANVTRPNVRATAFALNILIIHALGDAISPPILGAIHDHYQSWNPALYWVCAVMAGGAVFWTWGALYLQRDTDNVERAEVQPA